MTLSEDDISRIDSVHSNGHQASDLLPVLRTYAAEGYLEKIPEAIERFTRLSHINRGPVRTFLIARVPAIIVNHYWTKHPPPGLDYADIIQYTVAEASFADEIRNSVTNHRLSDCVNELNKKIVKWKGDQ